MVKERNARLISYLQGRSKRHCEKKKDQHLPATKRYKCVEAHRRREGFLCASTCRRARRNRECINTHNQACNRCKQELFIAERPMQQVNSPHGADKSNRSPYSYWRKCFLWIELLFVKHIKRNRVVQGDGRHITTAHEKHYPKHFDGVGHSGRPI